MSEKKKIENEKVMIQETESKQETENKQKAVSIDNSPEELNTENNSENDEEDLLYTHKPETQNGSIHWNSNFCRKPGH